MDNLESIRRTLLDRKTQLRKKLEDPTVAGRKKTYASEVELPRVEAALERLQSGTYGVCLECGQAIEADRLTAMPDIHTCKSCATDEHEIIRGLR